MKKITLTALILVTLVSISACTKKQAPQPTPSSMPVEQTQTQNVTDTDQTQAAEQPVTSFAPTNDEDVKAMDKSIGGVDLNEYKSDALSDLQ